MGRSKSYVSDQLRNYSIKRKGKLLHNNCVPYGLKYENGQKIINQKEQDIIEKMRDLEKNGFNYAQIAKVLNYEGFKTRKGVKWQRWSVRKVLEREKVQQAA